MTIKEQSKLINTDLFRIQNTTVYVPRKASPSVKQPNKPHPNAAIFNINQESIKTKVKVQST